MGVIKLKFLCYSGYLQYKNGESEKPVNLKLLNDAGWASNSNVTQLLAHLEATCEEL